MKVQLLEVKTNKSVDAQIEKALKKDMPIKKDGWQFTWRSLFKTEGAEFYRLSLIEANASIVEGMLMLTLMNDEMLYMNNIEVAPHNFGANGKYDKVAGCLIAYGCKKSFELGINQYKGYLTFENKTKLILLYQKKYGATLTMGQRMFIEPEVGLALIKKYLKTSDMSTKNNIINPGGVNGTGQGIVNANSKDYKGLQQAILEHSKKQTRQDRIKYELISLKYQMETYLSKQHPTEIIGVGEFLKRHLSAIRVKHKEFAQYINLEASNLSSIIKGRRKINTDLAFKLGQVFNLNPNLWLLIQSKNELLQMNHERKEAYQKYKLEDLLKKAV